MSDAREEAYLITRRVHEKGAYLGLLLRHRLEHSDLTAVDKALVTELAYGIQRYRNRLDYALAKFSRLPPKRLSPDLLDFLRLGIYQLLETRIPPHAAVGETVRAAEKHLDEGKRGYLNAVLRRASRESEEIHWPRREGSLRAYLEVTLSHPLWLVDYLLARYPPREAEEICAASNRLPPLTVRINPRKTTREDLARLAREAGGEARPSQLLEEGLTFVRLPWDALRGFLEKGLCVVQDEASILVSRLLAPRPGRLVIDACAAPGTKTTHLAVLGGKGCRVVAVDASPARMEALRKLVERWSLENVVLRTGDARRLADLVEIPADAVLVDAPCSDLGTLRRRPELKWRRKPENLKSVSRLQRELLEGAAGALRPGGTLVYSVCTFTEEETVQVVESFLRDHPEFVTDNLEPMLPAALAGEGRGGMLQLMPHRHGTDGMFMARLRREG
jgi:16S rRNA (cytosine967-C5)-methyltransferase